MTVVNDQIKRFASIAAASRFAGVVAGASVVAGRKIGRHLGGMVAAVENKVKFALESDSAAKATSSPEPAEADMPSGTQQSQQACSEAEVSDHDDGASSEAVVS